MKKIIVVLLALLPLAAMAQNTWETQKGKAVQPTKKRTAVFEKKNKVTDPKYLAGAVPVVNGQVVFTLDRDVPGASADVIYDKVYKVLEALTHEPNQIDGISKIAVADKAQHQVAARMKEWLVFQKTFLSLDQTIFNYSLIAKATDGHLHLTMERIGYQYETERPGGENEEVKAEDKITDEWALSKKGKKLAKYNGKFRVKTIDRKDDIFRKVCDGLGIE